ncbi:MAG: hypothetical protein QM536_00180 [Chitinophagaceae bacterium]|nr:hypothetical protein [Chitinophagaceae bacterium]
MNTVSVLLEFGKLLIPSGIILYATYLLVKVFLNKELEKHVLEAKMKDRQIVLPLKIQAYERMCLFLERISLQNIIQRVNNPDMTSGELQRLLIQEIRSEFHHNLAQQIYISESIWMEIKQAVEELIMFINKESLHIPQDTKSIDLIRHLLEESIRIEEQGVSKALRNLKEEARGVL